jgi:hypothetical protein
MRRAGNSVLKTLRASSWISFPIRTALSQVVSRFGPAVHQRNELTEVILSNFVNRGIR